MLLGACVPSVYLPYYFLQAYCLYLGRSKPGPIHFKSVRLVWQMSRMMLTYWVNPYQVVQKIKNWLLDRLRKN